MTRCKVGDTAVIVSTLGHPCYNAYVGRVVTVKGLDIPSPRYGVMWLVTGAHPLTAAADVALRPIRDPGDDARDETLEWLPVPTKETA